MEDSISAWTVYNVALRIIIHKLSQYYSKIILYSRYWIEHIMRFRKIQRYFANNKCGKALKLGVLNTITVFGRSSLFGIFRSILPFVLLYVSGFFDSKELSKDYYAKIFKHFFLSTVSNVINLLYAITFSWISNLAI